MIASTALLGQGIYTPSEAAFYARMRTQTLNRWLFGNAQGNAVVAPQINEPNDRVVTFLDFVQMLAVREIRTKHNVPLHKIRDAVAIATEHGISYPFAVKHKTFLFGDMSDEGHGEVVLEIGGKLLQASGKGKRNLVMPEVAELYMQDLYFDPDSGLANKYYPFGTATNKAIVMDPKVRFGEPFVYNSGYSAESLWQAYKTEGGIEAAAAAYGVSRSDIESVLRFYDLLGSAV
jgi:uncharacterized protein (DUF433 family)